MLNQFAENYGTYYPMAINAANTFGVPSKLFTSLINSESGFDPNARNGSAIGIAQFLKSTAANPGYGIAPFDPTDPTASLNGAAQYIKALYNKAVGKGLSGYDAWSDAVSAYKGYQYPESSKKVMDSSGMKSGDENSGTDETTGPLGLPTFDSIKKSFVNSLVGFSIGLVGLAIILLGVWALYRNGDKAVQQIKKAM